MQLIFVLVKKDLKNVSITLLIVLIYALSTINLIE